MQHSPYWIALSAESTLASDQVRLGAIGLGRLNPVSVGSFYAAFFALAIGYERMAKIAIQVDASLGVGSFLPSADMKKIGHRISALFDHVETIAHQRGYDTEPLCKRPADAVHTEIVDILTEFATTGRYDHLDSLGKPGHLADNAERQWNKGVLPFLIKHHLTPRMRRDIQAKALEVDAMTHAATSSGIGMSFLHQDIDGTLQTGAARIAERTLVYDKMTPWGRMYALQLGRWLAAILSELARQSSLSRRSILE
ncbi:MAG: hypothetical protein HZB45_27105 [Mycolicibacterium rufum]|nr:hypothetical protein [Mycolicibacterium rufum]